MYNVSGGINNVHFKLYPAIAQDVTPSAEGFVELEPERNHQYGCSRHLSFGFFLCMHTRVICLKFLLHLNLLCTDF